MYSLAIFSHEFSISSITSSSQATNSCLIPRLSRTSSRMPSAIIRPTVFSSAAILCSFLHVVSDTLIPCTILGEALNLLFRRQLAVCLITGIRFFTPLVFAMRKIHSQHITTTLRSVVKKKGSQPKL